MWDPREDVFEGFFGPTASPRPIYTFLRTTFTILGDWRVRPAPFEYRFFFADQLPGRSFSAYFGDGIEGVLVYWGSRTGRGVRLRIAPKEWEIGQMVDPTTLLYTDLQPQRQPDGWWLPDLPERPYPLMIEVRSGRFGYLAAPREKPEALP